MEEQKRKLKKITPLLKAKNAEVAKETAELMNIRAEKSQLADKLQEKKTAYIKGIDHLNEIRQNGPFNQLATLENSVDFIRKQWTQLFQEMQNMERIERQQLTLLTLAQQNLKAVEKLEEKYRFEFFHARNREEQRIQDEQAIKKNYADKKNATG
ncbi:MAG: hypothetical protein R3B45_06230 [Bdellovibrionota bacterium]